MGALIVDLVLAAIVIQVVAAVAYPLTGGGLQAMGGGIQFENCGPLTRLPAGATLPAGFRVDSLTACTQRFIVFPTSRTATAREMTRDGDTTKIRTFVWSLDSDGRVVPAIRLEAAAWPLMIVLRFLFDVAGGSPGRRICRQFLVPAEDAADAFGPAARKRFVRRYVFFALPLLPTLVAGVAFPAHGGMREVGLLSVGLFVPGIILAVALLAAAVAIAFRRDAFYDRAAGTHVVRA